MEKSKETKILLQRRIYNVSSIYSLNSLFQDIDVGTFKDSEQFIEMTLNLEK